MCGIAGIVKSAGETIDIDLLIRMTRSMAHRGPDEEGYFINTTPFWEPSSQGPHAQQDRNVPSRGVPIAGLIGSPGNVGFGHRRLSIIDLSSGQQPLSNEDGSIWITFNGEIYNFIELKTDLVSKGHRFKTNSDTETILHAYEQWGEDTPKKLRGMFAFAIWDQNRQQLFMARDRIGKKPFYYCREPRRFAFASEIKAILELPEVNQTLDFTAFSDYLTLSYIPSPKTIFSSIKKLPAGHYAIYDGENIITRSYWDLDFHPDHGITEAQAIDNLLGILEEATRIRMISEVPLGAFLSGGVDSSAVVAMMATIETDPVLTNSISFGEDTYNEAPYALEVANLFRTNHKVFQVTPETIPTIEKLAWHYDEPFADSSALPTYYVSKMARQNVTVSLSGDGGDENFAGYKRYYFDSRENRIRNLLPAVLQQPIFHFISKLYPQKDVLQRVFRGKAFVANLARDPVAAYMFNVSVFHHDAKKELLNPDVHKHISGYRTLDYFKNFYDKAPASDHLSKIQYLDIKSYLCEDILTKVDRASMAVSLEVRCPLLDHVFMEYVARIPKEKKLNGSQGKFIFKKALERYLPKNILYRSKMGFAVPVAQWLRSDIKDYARKLVIEGGASKAFLNGQYIEKLWHSHLHGKADHSFPLWSLMMLNLWYERFAR